MQHPTFYNEDLTIKKFGYRLSELPKGSHKFIIVTCSNCKKNIKKQARDVHRTHQCSVVENGQKKCFRCNQWKNLSEFNKCPKLSGGVAKLCRDCHNSHPSVIKCEKKRLKKKRNSFKDDFDLYIKCRVSSIKSRCSKKKIPFNLTSDFLKEIWEKQKGLCYYSHLPMISDGKEVNFQKWSSPSIDKKNPNKGYVKNNVVWCCFAVNAFKQRKSEKDFIKIVKNIKWKS